MVNWVNDGWVVVKYGKLGDGWVVVKWMMGEMMGKMMGKWWNSDIFRTMKINETVFLDVPGCKLSKHKTGMQGLTDINS